MPQELDQEKADLRASTPLRQFITPPPPRLAPLQELDQEKADLRASTPSAKS